MYNICFFCCPSPLLKKNLIENCKILISHFRKFNFLGSIVRFMLCFCFFFCVCVFMWVCVMPSVTARVFYVLFLFSNLLWVNVVRSHVGAIVRDLLWASRYLPGISLGTVFFCLLVVGKLHEAFVRSKLIVSN